MAKKVHWGLMSWQEIREAQKRNPVVIVPSGTAETQGPYTYVGLEILIPERLAAAVAEKRDVLITPTIPFGYSALFQDIIGTISIRPEILTGYFEDVARSIIRHGFDHVLFLAMHIPNQPMMEHVANKLRDELGVLIGWINPGALGGTILREISPNFAQARGHGADSGLSIAMYLEPDAIDKSSIVPNKFDRQFRGFDLEGQTPVVNGFPFNMAVRLQDISPESGGYGDPSFATAEQGKIIFDRMVEHLLVVVDKFAAMDTHV
jgi:creatinine amidohydrolase